MDRKAIVKKSCLGAQVGRSSLSVVLFIQWGNTSSVLRAIWKSARSPRSALFLRLAGVAGAEERERRGRYLLGEFNSISQYNMICEQKGTVSLFLLNPNHSNEK